MIRSNFRGTREISGDFRAQTAANRLGAQRIEALVAQYGAATLAHYLDELLRYTERRTRAAFAEFPDGRFAADMLMDGDGVTDQPVKLAATVTIEQGRAVRRPHRLRRPAQIAHERDVVADLLGRGVRAEVPHRSGHPGERRLLPAHRHPEPPRLGGPRAASRRGGRGLGDRHAALRPAVQGAGPRAARSRGGGHEGLRVQYRVRRSQSGDRRVLHLLRDHRGRLRGHAHHRRHGRGAGALPEHRERAGRGDRGQLPGAHPALRPHRELGGRRAPPRRPRRAARLHVPRPRAELLDSLRQGQVRPVGALRRRRGPARQVHPEPGHDRRRASCRRRSPSSSRPATW